MIDDIIMLIVHKIWDRRMERASRQYHDCLDAKEYDACEDERAVEERTFHQLYPHKWETPPLYLLAKLLIKGSSS